MNSGFSKKIFSFYKISKKGPIFSGMFMRRIAHVDIDCFFVQAEILDRKELSGKPVAVFQHDDILSVSYEAQELGIKRHDSPAEIKEKYPEVTLLSVPQEAGTTKVSYNKVKKKPFTRFLIK